MRAAAATILALLVMGAGCGGDEPTGDARKGGSITVGASAIPAVLDPALATERLALQTLWNVYTPPLTYRHAEGREGTEVVPGLARELPEISDDGLTYSFTFRRGLRYSNGAVLRPADFDRAVRRLRRVDSPYAALYRGISAIESNDRSRRVVVTLSEPDADFAQVLALPSSAPVPRGTPSTDLSRRPPPGIGAYAIAGVRPAQRLVLRRVQGFQAPELPTGNVDELTIERQGDAARQARDVKAGILDVMQELPPSAQLPEIRSKYDDRYEEQATASSLFFLPETAVPPFDDRRVRQAVSMAVDGPTLERLYTGRLEPGCNIVPPAVPGHSKPDPCPYGERSAPPDLLRARELIQEAGQENARALVVASRADAPASVPLYYAATLRKIGLAAATRFVPAGGELPPAAPGPWITLRRVAPPIAHPEAYLGGFAGRTGDFELDTDLQRLMAGPPSDETGDDWAALDRRVVEEGYAAPLGSEKLPTFLSERMEAHGCRVFHPVFASDFASLCLK